MIPMLLDALLPGDRDFPSGGSLALPIERHERFGPPLAAVLKRLPDEFASLAPDGRTAAVAAAEAAEPVAFAAMLTGAYSLYYSHPDVGAALHHLFGHSGAPPQPQGHPLPSFDPSLLSVPAARPPFFRPTPEVP